MMATSTLSSDGSDDGDDYNETSFMSRMSSTTTENEEDDQGLDRIRMLMLNYYGNEGFDEDEEEDEEAKMHDIDGENFDVDVYLNNLLKTETFQICSNAPRNFGRKPELLIATCRTWYMKITVNSYVQQILYVL